MKGSLGYLLGSCRRRARIAVSYAYKKGIENLQPPDWAMLPPFLGSTSELKFHLISGGYKTMLMFYAQIVPHLDRITLKYRMQAILRKHFTLSYKPMQRFWF